MNRIEKVVPEEWDRVASANLTAPLWGLLSDEAKDHFIATARAVDAALHPTLTTVEDVEALPPGVILRDSEGTVWETGTEDGVDYLCPIGDEDGYGAGEVPLPAIVLYRP